MGKILIDLIYIQLVKKLFCKNCAQRSKRSEYNFSTFAFHFNKACICIHRSWFPCENLKHEDMKFYCESFVCLHFIRTVTC